ncbi:MAG: cytochrome c family protein [Deltaproteobacteria bacterium]|jgi:hypothetical protein|nr:cytochrome c family protein [Deltaproteobacteria bacterium]
MKRRVLFAAVFLTAGLLGVGTDRAWAAEASFVGSAACAACHEDIYARFQTDSKKAHTRDKVEKMLDKLTPEEQQTCFQCHATGYGKPGGFISYAQTPALGDIGCESCHGAGSLHSEGGDTEQIRHRPSPEQCLTCHTAERNGDFKPLLYGGTH